MPTFSELGVRAVVQNASGFVSDLGKMERATQGTAAQLGKMQNRQRSGLVSSASD